MSLKNPKKLKGQRKTQDPCETCFLHRSRCICHLIPSLELSTRLILVVHAKELKRTTNTGRLATLALKNSQLFVRGLEGQSLDLTDQLHLGYESLLLYPSDDAIEISTLSVERKRPVQLIVPDGNWRQASKVSFRQKELGALQRVKVSALSDVGASQETLRKEHFENGLSTLQAIAYAMGHFEGHEVKQSLMNLYLAKLNATLQGRQQT